MRLYEVTSPYGSTVVTATTAGKARYEVVLASDGAASFQDLRVRSLGPAPESGPEPDYDAEMRLPPGATCADCFASCFCIGVGCASADATSCDYHPNRFRARKQEGAA